MSRVTILFAPTRTNHPANTRGRGEKDGEAAHKAPNLAERDHLTRQAARLNTRTRT